jgi:2,3-bisphosphoglycerate-independent phosphoglycerate mutase
MNKAMLIILDGFGHSEETSNNAIAQAKTPFIDKLKNEYPHSLIQTDGGAVGLPDGVMGNSEVGHLTIGSGRVIYQDLTKITKYIKEQGFKKHKFMNDLKSIKGKIHVMGLLSDGGVHSHQDHAIALLKDLSEELTNEICFHMISDGRDTSPTSGINFAKNLEASTSSLKNLSLASVVGRFYAMDRDKRWERVKLAYDMLSAKEEAPSFESLSEAIQNSYDNEETDEFIKPRRTKDFSPIGPDDAVIFFNFRSDRAREISQAFCETDFSELERDFVFPARNWFTFTKYREDFSFPVFFEKESPQNILGEVVSKAGGKQLRCAETEKYAHVTFFLNGGKEDVFSGEDRILVDSPRDVATYDLKPEMSAPEVTEKLVEAVSAKNYDLIVVNYANGDMVGHTGNKEAAIKAVECLDQCLAKLIPACLEAGYEALITADHGNCEEMQNLESGEVLTQHSTNQVPLLWVGEKAKMAKLRNGGLADIAPSVLHLMGLEIPADMTGKVLINS